MDICDSKHGLVMFWSQDAEVAELTSRVVLVVFVLVINGVEWLYHHQ